MTLRNVENPCCSVRAGNRRTSVRRLSDGSLCAIPLTVPGDFFPVEGLCHPNNDIMGVSCWSMGKVTNNEQGKSTYSCWEGFSAGIRSLRGRLRPTKKGVVENVPQPLEFTMVEVCGIEPQTS